MSAKVNDTIFTTTEAAKYLGLSLDTVRKYVQRRLITPATTIGRSYLITKTECDRYKRDRRPQGKPKRMSA